MWSHFDDAKTSRAATFITDWKHCARCSGMPEGGSEKNLLLWERKVVLLQIVLDSAEPHDAGMT